MMALKPKPPSSRAEVRALLDRLVQVTEEIVGDVRAHLDREDDDDAEVSDEQ